MRVIGKILLVLVSVFAGYGAGLLLSMLALGAAGVSDFEGERATVAALVFGPMGALAGFFAGVFFAQRLSGGASRPGAMARLAGMSALVLVALAGGGALIAVLLSEPKWTNGAPPRLAFEIRAPAELASGKDTRAWRVNLGTPYNQMPATLSSPPVRKDGDALVIAGEVELYYRTSRRVLALELGEGESQVFELALPATPKASTAWSQWSRVTKVFARGQTQGRTPRENESAQIRTRLSVF